jgi:hypothetical protein
MKENSVIVKIAHLEQHVHDYTKELMNEYIAEYVDLPYNYKVIAFRPVRYTDDAFISIHGEIKEPVFEVEGKSPRFIIKITESEKKYEYVWIGEGIVRDEHYYLSSGEEMLSYKNLKNRKRISKDRFIRLEVK